MITGVHALMYAEDAAATRKFLGATLGLPSVDAGRGWLIFALPPAEVGVHPDEGEGNRHELFLMCDELAATMQELRGKGVEFVGQISDQPWGTVVRLKVPGGGTMCLYQPKHPLAIGLKR